PARANHELANARLRVRGAGRGLRSEAFVVVLVPVQYQLRVGVVQHLPRGLHRGRAAVGRARAEARSIEVGDNAAARRRGEVVLQPLELRRCGADIDLRVERHHVPGAEVVAVIALPRRPGRAAEVAEIGGSPGGVVVVNPGRGTGTRLVATPGRVVAVREVAGRAVGIDVVTGRVHRSLYPIQQRGRGFVAGRAAVGDVARAHEHHASRRSEEHTSELQSLAYLVCRLLLEKKNTNTVVLSLFIAPASSRPCNSSSFNSS